MPIAPINMSIALSDNERTRPILQGRHLIAAGLTPGKPFKALLHEAFEAQLEGQFGDLEGAEAWLKQRIA